MTVIVGRFPEDTFLGLMTHVHEESPLKQVMPHVAKAQLERAYSIGIGTFLAAVREAEKELCRLYVTDEFCGLCGRYTDHVGEH